MVAGRIEDRRRVEYFRNHLKAAHEAICQGVKLQGYFAWSLLDNFEWAAGYYKRFGLVHVDDSTQLRTVKESGWFYRHVIETNGRAIEQSSGAEVEG